MIRNQNFKKVKSQLLRVHCEDAAFLFELREKAIEAPNYRIIDVYDLEERIRGHLTAVLSAQEAGAAMAADVLNENQGSGEIFLAAYVVLNRTGMKGLVTFLDQWDADLLNERAFTLALAWCKPELLSQFMSDWISSADPRLAALALNVCAEHRVDPKHHLPAALNLVDVRTRSAALRTAGCCGREDLCGAVLEYLGEPGRVGYDAAFAATLLGDRAKAPQGLGAAIVSDSTGPQARMAAELAPLGMGSDEAQELIRTLLSTPETSRWGIIAIGSLGHSISLNWLIQKMTEPCFARVAGAAFGTITGADLKDPELELTEFPEDPEDPIVEANPTEAFHEGNLPWPEVEGVRSWLDTNGSRFAPDTRYFLGVPAWTYSSEDLSGIQYQAQMRGLCLELAMRNANAPLPNWHGAVRITDGNFSRKW